MNLLSGMSKKRIYWMLQIGGWMLFAAINLFLTYLQHNLNIYSFFYAVLLSGWFIVSTHIFRHFIQRWKWLELRVNAIIIKVLLFIAVLTVTNFMVHLLILISLGVFNYEYDLDPSIIGANVLSTFFIYFAWALIYFIYHYFERYNTALKYEALKNEVELNNLKTQLNPHFIFNALNSIRALVDENPQKAKEAITQLSSILRSSLVISRNKLTSFADELNAVRDYLDLESMRFEERLKVRFDIDPGTLNCMVPPMMVQTLVENGIKHGISRLKEGGIISLEAKMEKSMLKIKIRNNGHYNSHDIKPNKGFGLENTVKRLKLLYGNSALFRITNENQNTVLTEIRLPQNVEVAHADILR